MNLRNSIFFILYTGLIVSVILSISSWQFVNEFANRREQQTDTIATHPKIDVKGLTALFIGDSHTANNSFGWQTQLCQRTGMIMKNVSVSGKTTDWMLNQGVYAMNDKINILFIYGGANDMYNGRISPDDCIDNIQRLVNLGKGRKAKVYVITGFDPMKAVTVNNQGYKKRYARLQELMLTELKGCQVIDTRMSVVLSDCGDGLCHMKRSGHTKMAARIIEVLNFSTINPAK